MLVTIHNEVPFQILSSSFSIGPSQTGYELQVGADSKTFSTLFSVGANTPRMVTNVANGSYFRLKNNVGDVKVNWQRVCVDEGGADGTELQPIDYFPLNAVEGTVISYTGSSSASGVYQYDGSEWVAVGVDDLSAYWTSAQTKDYVDTAVSGIDLSNYYTKAETDSAITAVEDHIYDVEKVTASALTELHNDILELSANTPDLSAYWSSAETKDYVDSASTALQEQIDTMDDVVSAALVDLNERIGEISGSSVDLSDYYTSAQTKEAISAATAGKADAANVSANTSDYVFPAWNEDGVVTGEVKKAYKNNIKLNNYPLDVYGLNRDNLAFFAPTAGGTAGDILVSRGNGTPVWSAMPAPDVTKAYVDSADTALQEQIDTMDEVVSEALVDLNTRKVESTYVSTIWKGTTAEYDAIVTKDPATLYIIVNNS